MGYFLRLKSRPADPTRALLEASRSLNSTLDVDALCGILAQSAVRLAAGDGACAGLRQGSGLVCRAQVRHGRLLARPDPRLRPELGLPGRLEEDCSRALIENEAGGSAAYRALGVRSVLAVPLCDAGGKMVGFFEVYNKEAGFTDGEAELLTALGDIASTAIQNAQAFARARRSEAAAREAMEQLEALSYAVAHDLRAPLRGIASFADIVLARNLSRLDEEGRRHLERIRCASVKMGRLIDNILSLARVSREPLHPRRVNLSELAAGLLRDLHHAEPERKVEARVQPSLWAVCDDRLVSVALRQLLHNAWKATAARREPVIEFQLKDDAFCVRDNGAGFKQEQAGGFFGPLRVGSGGTGVGLALVDRIVRRHGGRCWAEGSEGRGASFYFTLGPR